MSSDRKLLLLTLLIFGVFLLVQGQASGQDPGVRDTVYFSCGSDSSSNGDTLYIPCNGTHDVKIKVQFWNDESGAADSLVAMSIPLVDQCYDPATAAFLDPTKNTSALAYAGSRLVPLWSTLSVNIDNDLHKVLYGAFAVLNPAIGPGNGLFATMTLTVRDTGRICLDSTFFPPTNRLQFSTKGAVGFTPVFRPDTFVVAARTLNRFPVLTLPADVDTALTAPQNLCIPGIQATDPDAGNTITLEKIEGPGTFVPKAKTMPGTIIDSICFLPANADSTYRFIFRVRDQCPAYVYDTFYVTVNISQRPILTVPTNVDTFLCQPANLCIYNITATDADAEDTLILQKVEGPGTFVPDTGLSPLTDNICFTPASRDSTYRFIFRVTDPTLLSDQDTFYVTVDIDNAPALAVPADFDTSLPPGQSLCIKYITATDPNPGDTIVLEKVSGPGTFIQRKGISPLSDSIRFDPASKDSTYQFVFKVTDSCDSTRQDTFYVYVNINRPPVLFLPEDRDTFLCEAQAICFDSLIASDPDSADTFIVTKIAGPGTFDPDSGISPDSINTSHCFTPAGKDSTYRFIFEAVDSSGATDRDTFNLTVNINDPPLITGPDTLWVIKAASKKDTLVVADPDSNSVLDSAGVTLDPNCGEYSVVRISNAGGASGKWEVSFNDTGCLVDTIYRMVVDIRDTIPGICPSKTRYDTIFVIIRSQDHYNHVPIVFPPPNMAGYIGNTLELIFRGADPDSDVILDTSAVWVTPTYCGSTSTERLTPPGEPSGEWKVTFYTEGCSPGNHWVQLNLRDALLAWGLDSALVTLSATDVPETSSIRESDFILEQNYPNPFNQKTGLSFQIPYGCHVSLKIYNLAGQLVQTLVNEQLEKGKRAVFWNGTDYRGDPVASGIYFYKLTAQDFVCVRKMILLK